jgi:predicted ATPase
LLPEEELKALQYEMGSILVSQSDKNHLGSIFVAVNLLNEGMPATSNTDTQLELARSNLAAALNAVNVSAFESASKYVSKGVTLMPVDSWSRHQSLALELHSLGAEVNGCLGNIAEMELHCNKVLEQDIPLLDKMRVYYVILDSTADRQNIPKALHLCMEVLKNLGCTFPRCALSVNIVTIANVLKFQSQADSRSLDEIANMAPMTDRRRIEVMRLLDKLATYCYLSENILFPVTILRRLKYTLCYGVTDYSAVDFVGLALILTAKLLDFQAGSAYANYSMLLLERIDSKRSHSRVYMVAYAFVFPWTQPTQSVLKYLLMAYEYGM